MRRAGANDFRGGIGGGGRRPREAELFGNIEAMFGNMAQLFGNIAQSFSKTETTLGKKTKSFGKTETALGKKTKSFGKTGTTLDSPKIQILSDWEDAVFQYLALAARLRLPDYFCLDESNIQMALSQVGLLDSHDRMEYFDVGFGEINIGITGSIHAFRQDVVERRRNFYGTTSWLVRIGYCFMKCVKSGIERETVRESD